MMKICFEKYQGTGNDFIIVDNQEIGWKPSPGQIKHLCDRHFGIGADGLMLFGQYPGLDFGMRYFNADGFESTMCGNGGRCITAYAGKRYPGRSSFRFGAVDGMHVATITGQDSMGVLVNLRMTDTDFGIVHSDGVFINTGSPHFVLFTDNADYIDLCRTGREIRNETRFSPGGVNVDFVQPVTEGLYVRTYERGVEDETLSCGTGVTAAALVYAQQSGQSLDHVKVSTRGGLLRVSFTKVQTGFTGIRLEGLASFVFQGEIIVD
jgi:diaminopimelate epimerase